MVRSRPSENIRSVRSNTGLTAWPAGRSLCPFPPPRCGKSPQVGEQVVGVIRADGSLPIVGREAATMAGKSVFREVGACCRATVPGRLTGQAGEVGPQGGVDLVICVQ